MFLTGPAVVSEVMGEDVDAAELGGPKVHDRNGVAHFVARTDVRRRAARARPARPPALARRPAGCPSGAPPTRSCATRAPSCPSPSRKVYDVRDVVRGVIDGGRLLEWAHALGAQPRLRLRAASTASPVGIVANQPRYLGGVLDAESAAKGGALRAHLQRVRPAARRARRHARLPARHASRSRAA